jgi:hypothetical protein
MKANDGVDVQIHALPGEGTPDIHSLAGCVKPTGGLDAMEKITLLTSQRFELRALRRLARSQSLYITARILTLQLQFDRTVS